MSRTNGQQIGLDDTPERDALRSMLALRVLFHNFVGMSSRRPYVQEIAYQLCVDDQFELMTMVISDLTEVVNRGEIR